MLERGEKQSKTWKRLQTNTESEKTKMTDKKMW